MLQDGLKVIDVPATELVAVGTVKKYTLGTLYVNPDTKAVYRYVRADTDETITIAANDPVGYIGTTPWMVCGDLSDIHSTQALVSASFAGIAQGALIVNLYGWICIKGWCTASVKDSSGGGLAVGQSLTWIQDGFIEDLTPGGAGVICAVLRSAVAVSGATEDDTVSLLGVG